VISGRSLPVAWGSRDDGDKHLTFDLGDALMVEIRQVGRFFSRPQLTFPLGLPLISHHRFVFGG
jgi:hypothetical protein